MNNHRKNLARLVQAEAAGIQVTSYPGERGRKCVHVGGELWATIHCAWHGCHGTSFAFRNSEGERVMVPYGHAVALTQPFKVMGDKMARRAAGVSKYGPQDEVPKPINERLYEAVRELIREGHLKSPAEEAAEREEANRKFRESMDRGKAEEAAKLDQRARHVVRYFLDKYPGTFVQPSPASETLEACIVKAMKWAQTQ